MHTWWKTLVANASLISLGPLRYAFCSLWICEICIFYVNCALVSAKMFMLLKKNLLQHSRPSGCCEIVWVLSDCLAAVSPALRLAGFRMIWWLFYHLIISSMLQTIYSLGKFFWKALRSWKVRSCNVPEGCEPPIISSVRQLSCLKLFMVFVYVDIKPGPLSGLGVVEICKPVVSEPTI